jgi:tetratricopeptide (TPR) repeat protein
MKAAETPSQNPESPCPCGSGKPYQECCMPLAGRQTVQEALEQGLEHLKLSQLPEAEALFRKILTTAPRHPDALHLLGLIAYHDGRYGEAVSLIRRAIRHNPKSARLYNSLAQALLAQGDADAAIRNYRMALAHEPQHPDVHANLGLAHRTQGRIDAAQSHYREALMADPDHEAARQWLYSDLNPWQTAQFMGYRQNAAIHTARPGRYGYYSAKPLPAPSFPEPQELDTRLQEAARHHEAGRFEAAEQGYREILRLDPEYAEALHLLGLLAHHAGRHEEGGEMIARAVDIDDTNPVYPANLASTLMAVGRLQEAQEYYVRALRIRPNFAEAYYNLGNVCRELGNLPDAIANYELALWYRKDYVEAHANLGLVLYESGRFEEAVNQFNTALELDPNLPDVRAVLEMALNAAGSSS